MSPIRPPQHIVQRVRAPRFAAVCGVVVGAALALVIFAPAAWLASLVHWGSNGRLMLASTQGTIWKGSGQVVFTGGVGSLDASSLPGRLSWRLRPQFWGFGIQLEAPCCIRQVAWIDFDLGRSGVQISARSVRADLPAQLLVGLGAPWNTLAPQGIISLNISALQSRLAPSGFTLKGAATADLIAMSSRLSTLAPLGDYRVTLTGGDMTTVQLQTLQGALQLSGSGQWVGSRLRFSGEALTQAEHQYSLNNVLNILGRRQGPKSVISIG